MVVLSTAVYAVQPIRKLFTKTDKIYNRLYLSHVVLTYLVRSRIRCISLSPMLMPSKAVIVQSYNISCAKFDYSVTSLYTVLPFATFGNFDVSAMLLLSYRLHYLIYSVLCFFQARLWTFFKFFSTLVFRSLSYCFTYNIHLTLIFSSSFLNFFWIIFLYQKTYHFIIHCYLQLVEIIEIKFYF